LCPQSNSDMTRDTIFLPVQGEVNLGRTLLRINDRKISRNHISMLVDENALFVKLLHHNPCHYKPKYSTIFHEISTKEYQQLEIGDTLSLMWTYHFDIGFMDSSNAPPPSPLVNRARSNSIATEVNHVPAQGQLYCNPVLRQVDKGPVEEVIDEDVPNGDLASHMSWRDPDKGLPEFKSCIPHDTGFKTATGTGDVPGPDRYHQDWLVVSVSEDVQKVVLPESDDQDDLFSENSLDKGIYNANVRKKASIWRGLCGNVPKSDV